MNAIVKKDDYYGLVITKKNDFYFITSPSLEKVYPKALQNADAYQKYLDFISSHNLKRGFARIKYEDAEDIEIGNTDPIAFIKKHTVSMRDLNNKGVIEDFLIKEFFGIKKNIISLVEIKKETDMFKEILSFSIEKLNTLKSKIEEIEENLDDSANNKDINSIKKYSEISLNIFKKLKTTNILDLVEELNQKFNYKTKTNDIDINKFLGL